MRIMKMLALVVAVPALGAGAALAASSPTVSTGSAKSITESGATLIGSVNPQGVNTTYLFQVGLSSGTYTISTAGHSAGSGKKTVSAEAGIGSLAPATVYHYRIVATSTAGFSTGTDRSFTTGGHPAPVAVTGPATQIGHAFAVVTGSLSTNAEATTYLFQYGTGPGYSSQTMGVTVPASTTPVPVSQVITGLQAGTTFHYRLVALHGFLSGGQGADATFTTLPFPRLVSRVRARTLPTIAASRPYVFTTTGTVLRPSQLPPGVGCTGVVAVRFLNSHRVLATRLAAVQADCTFSTVVTFHRLVGRTKADRRLRVQLRFRGNGYLLPAAARPERVVIGLP